MIARIAIAAVMLAAPTVAGAQAYSCSAPSGRMQIRPDLPSESQPQRLLPIGGYTLAITWAPQYCHDHAREPSARFQCGSGNRFGFTLHGLWPDGIGKDWPQYCTATALLPQAVVKRHLCATPSAQLIQHEWAKHGTCMAGITPTQFFDRSNGLYARAALSRHGRAVAADADREIVCAGDGARQSGARRQDDANYRDAARVLDEVWICLDKSFRYARCPVHQGGLPPTAQDQDLAGVR